MAYDQIGGSAAGLAARLDAELRDAHPLTILRVAYQHFGSRLALVSSFGAESAVLLHMIAQIKPDTPILFIDTGYHFPETLAYRDELVARFQLPIQNLTSVMHHVDPAKLNSVLSAIAE